MIVRKLRLQRGWSQEHLAALTGLNIRTIQRIERGQTPSLESKKSLAAVFDVTVATIDEQTQQNEAAEPSTHTEVSMTETKTESVTKDEEYAMRYIAGVKDFYTHLLVYIPLSLVILFKKGDESGVLLGLAGWTIGLIIHGLIAFEKLNLFSANWERKLIEKKLGRKL